MTVRKTNVITLEEVLGIQLECKDCHVRVNVPLSSKKAAIPSKCAHCGNQWVIDGRTDLRQSFFTAVKDFVTGVTEIAKGSLNVNCAFSVEVKPEVRSDIEHENFQ